MFSFCIKLTMIIVLFTSINLFIEDNSLSIESNLTNIKHDIFKKNKDMYSVIFLGTSIIHSGINPRQFSAELNHHGLKNIKAFNFALPASVLMEQYYIFRKITRMKPKKLKWVFVELIENRFDALQTRAQKKQTHKFVYWHDFKSTISLVNFQLSRNDNFLKRLKKIKTHLKSFATNYSKPGYGVKFLKVNKTNKNHDRLYKLFSKYMFKPNIPENYQNKKNQQGSLHHKYLQNIEKIHEFVKKLKLSKQKYQLSKEQIKLLYHFINHGYKHNIKIIFIMTPNNNSLNKRFIYDKVKHHNLHILEFKDPNQFPNLYKPKYHFNKNHFNIEGANIFSKKLAEQFILLLRNKTI